MASSEELFFVGHEFSRTPLGDRIDKASLKTLKEAYLSATDTNVVTSPLGALLLLSLYSAGAQGKSREEIMQFLGSTKYKEAGEKSKGHIKDPLSENLLDKSAAAALFNVTYFQGHWHVPFQAAETEEKDFHVNRSLVVKKPMMHLQRSLSYKDTNIGIRVIELPYEIASLRIVVILPDKMEDLPSVLEKEINLDDVFALSPTGRKINLYLPKFEIRSKLDFTQILPKLDVNRIFSDGAPGIVKEGEVTVSKFFQETIVKVDEEGATAGAFTGERVGRSSAGEKGEDAGTAMAIPASSHSKPPEPMDFIVDHPFLFVILHEDVVLFTGVYTH